MKNNSFDIAIVGAGLVGLVAGLLAAKQGFSVVFIDKKAKLNTTLTEDVQARTIAINQTTIQLMYALNIWQWIDKSRLGFIDSMLVKDGLDATMVLNNAANSSEPMSIVIEYAHIEAAFYQACLLQNNITFYCEQSIESIIHHAQDVSIKTNDHLMDAKLLIGADGANSWLAKYLHVAKEKLPYHHTACIGLAKTESGSINQAYQVFEKDYVLGMLPMGKPNLYSIIWSCKDSVKQELESAEKNMQDCLLTNAAFNQLGFMQWQTPIAYIPLYRQHLDHYIANRAVFIGDASHRVHPLAGQGANMGIADACALIDVLTDAANNKRDIGSERVLKQYQLQQQPKNNQALIMHDVLKDSLSDSHLVVAQGRKIAFKAIDQSKWLQRLMQKVVD